MAQRSSLRIRTLGLAAILTLSLPAQDGCAEGHKGTPVQTVKAAHRCFAATVDVTGSVVPKAIAIVAADTNHFRQAELLVKEGEHVEASQRVARLAAQRSGNAQDWVAADSYLYAPSAGKAFKVANTATAAEPLIQIAVNDEFEVQAGIPATHISQLALGQSVRVYLNNDQDMLGRLRLLPSEVNRVTQLGEARIQVEDVRNLPAGTFVNVSIQAGRSCGVSVPSSAVLHRRGVTSIQVIRDNLVTTRQVKLGLVSDDHTEVVQGLELGETIIASAGASLHDGDAVNPSIASPGSE